MMQTRLIIDGDVYSISLFPDTDAEARILALLSRDGPIGLSFRWKGHESNQRAERLDIIQRPLPAEHEHES